MCWILSVLAWVPLTWSFKSRNIPEGEWVVQVLVFLFFFFCHVLGMAVTNLTQIWYLPRSPGILPHSQAFWNSSLRFGIPADHSLHKSKQSWALPSPHSSYRNLSHALVTCRLSHCYYSWNCAKLLLFTEWGTESAHLPVYGLHFDKDVYVGCGKATFQSLTNT